VVGGPKSDKDAFLKTKSKLEKLLAMPDVFEALRSVNSGVVRSYDDLDKQPRSKELYANQSEAQRSGSLLTTSQI